LICTDFTSENIIEYCGTYFGTHHGGLKSMFANPTYLQLDDGVCDDENYNQDRVDEVSIIDIGGLVTTNEDGHCDNVDVPKGLSTPMD
jgi:hypothetical protein